MDLNYANDFVTAAMALRRNGIGPDLLRIIREYLPTIWNMLTADLMDDRCDGVSTYNKPDGAIVFLSINVHEEEELVFDPEDEGDDDPESRVTYEYTYTCYELRDFKKRHYFCEDCLDSGISCHCVDRIPNLDGTEHPDFIEIGNSGLWLERVWDSYKDYDCLFEEDDVEWRHSDFEGHGRANGRRRLSQIIDVDVRRWHDWRHPRTGTLSKW